MNASQSQPLTATADAATSGAEPSAVRSTAVQCWPEGHATHHPCGNEIPDTDDATMSRFGWGWVWARDDGSSTGIGPFYACPEHRDDCTEEERQVARERYAKALGADPKAGA